jgi:uncharacterized protein
MIELLLMMTLGFLGSFGHCASMCGPLAVALATGRINAAFPAKNQHWQKSWWFHGVMNLSRILSYALGGAILGGLSALALAGGQMVGVGSQLRSAIALIGGLLLIGSGLGQIAPGEWPIPRFGQGHWFGRATRQPWLLGLLWGLMPCGFLYTAQLKAIESGSMLNGAVNLLAFGLGTTPVMMGIGVSAGFFSLERRSQLRRAGGWIAIIVGIITLGRSGDGMSDGTGYGAIICLMLALIARPISKLWPGLLNYRRLLGVGAAVLSIAHLGHVVVHNWDWQPGALQFLLPAQQTGAWLGIGALLLLLPAAGTSSDKLQTQLGDKWRKFHLLAVPALLLAAGHAVLCGASYLGTVQPNVWNGLRSVAMVAIVAFVLLLRHPKVWSLLSLERFYAPPKS